MQDSLSEGVLMGSVVGFLVLIVIAGLLLAFGFARNVPTYLVAGFLILAVAGIFGAKGRIPEQP
jgi:uncharacterized membrane protein YccC